MPIPSKVIPVFAENGCFPGILCLLGSAAFVKDGPRGNKDVAQRSLAEKRVELVDCLTVMLIVLIVKADQKTGINANSGHQASSTVAEA